MLHFSKHFSKSSRSNPVDLMQFNSLIKETFDESNNLRHFIFALTFEDSKENYYIPTNSEFCYFKKKVNYMGLSYIIG